jgi:hypothetical protein
LCNLSEGFEIFHITYDMFDINHINIKLIKLCLTLYDLLCTTFEYNKIEKVLWWIRNTDKRKAHKNGSRTDITILMRGVKVEKKQHITNGIWLKYFGICFRRDI